MPGERGGLAGDALHHVAVRAQGVGVVVDDGVPRLVVGRPEERLRDGEADARGRALAEGTGGHLDAGRHHVLGVAGGFGVKLPKALEVAEGKIVARQVEKAVEQHRAVARREDEPVAVDPLGVLGVELQVPRVEGVGDGGAPEGQPRVAALGGLDGVEGESPDGVDATGAQIGHRA